MNTATLAPLPPLREVIARHGLSARRSLGQHFLLDPALAARIVRAAGPLTGRHVVEIGAGPGGLTRALLASEAESILAVEVDPRAVGALEELAVHASGRLQILAADARALDLAALVPPPRQIIANLPYNIGTSLLIGWLHQADAFEQMTLMFQEEVAQRIIAAPNSAAYGRLSVLAQFVCDVRLVLRLSPQAFVPPPKVSSAVVQLRPRRPLPDTRLREALERLTAAAFGQRRKMLRRTLAPLGGEALLTRAGISGERRAESLSVAEFAQLAALLA